MRKSINIIAWLVATLFVATSCEKGVSVYDTPDNRLNFYLKSNADGTKIIDSVKVNYSFVYYGNVQEDTVWLKMSTIGFVEDVDRPFELQQVMTGKNDAVAGTHYLSFDNEELRKRFYFIPAGQAETMIPVVVLRDASLKTKEVTLKMAVKENGYFKPGYEAYKYRIVAISDMLSKPSVWDTYYLDYAIGIYTPGIHQFMIDQTGEKWDDSYIDEISQDDGFVNYMAAWFQKKLEQVNAERVAAGLDVLRESDGVTAVKFTVRSWWD